jgi:hypothetical protein
VLQRIIAAVMVVAGLVVVGLAVASATIWRESDTIVSSASAAKGGTLIVTEPGVLNLVSDKVTINAKADGGVTVAIGREVDVEGWVGSDSATRVTGLADWTRLATAAVKASPTPTATGDAASQEPAPTDAATLPANPTGSDMWIAEASGSGSAKLTWSTTPGRWMLLVAATGESAGPPTVDLTWHRTVTTPLLWPGVALGAVLIVAGGLWLVLVWRAQRLSAGSESTPDLLDKSSPKAGISGGAGAPASAQPAQGRPVEPEPITRVMTRREIREHEEVQREAGRPKRNWLTGSIPVVPRERRPKTSAQPAVTPTAPESRGDAWRRAWGMDADTTPKHVPPVEVGTDDVPAASSPAATSPAATHTALPGRRSRRGTQPSADPRADIPPIDDPATEPQPRRRGRRHFSDDADGGQQ